MAININGTGSITGLSSISAPGISGVPVGSASAPAFSFTGDTNTGIYSPGADQVAISTNSSERIRIGANGEVGIGGANYGTSGQVLTSGGSGAAPSWQTLSVSANSITQGNTSATVTDTGSDGRFVVTTEGSERVRVDSSGRLLVGTSTNYAVPATIAGPAAALTTGNGAYAVLSVADTNSMATGVGGGIAFQGNDGANGLVAFSQVQGFKENSTSGNFAGGLSFSTRLNNASLTERARIDSFGRLLVGTSSAYTTYAGSDSAKYQQVGSDYQSASIQTATFANTSGGGGLTLALSRNATPGSHTVVQNGDTLGQVRFMGSDGTSFKAGALIEGTVDGTPGANDMPGRLMFYTTADGASSPTERMRITSGGKLLFQTTSPLQGEDQVEFRVPFDVAGGKGGVGFYNSNTTTNSDAAAPILVYKGSTTTSSNARFIQFYAGGTATPMGGIVGNGSNNVQFASISDIRDKKNVEPLSGSLEKVKQLEVVSYDWIANDEHVAAGFIAQNVEAVFPEYVVENMSNGSQEARKGITGGLSSGYVAVLTAALQEAVAKIETLEAKVAALESA